MLCASPLRPVWFHSISNTIKAFGEEERSSITKESVGEERKGGMIFGKSTKRNIRTTNRFPLTSNGGRRSRRNSSELASTLGGSRWKRMTNRATSQQPFKLGTEVSVYSRLRL
ncbi:hypothetical protein Hdeb2414_s0021g00575471 [Helianthus debilis subsp. tardiflorus]